VKYRSSSYKSGNEAKRGRNFRDFSLLRRPALVLRLGRVALEERKTRLSFQGGKPRSPLERERPPPSPLPFLHFTSSLLVSPVMEFEAAQVVEVRSPTLLSISQANLSLPQAIVALYSPSTPHHQQQQLQSSLQQVQASPSSWTLIPPLISHPEPSVRFFAASTLQSKISRQWDSLPLSAPPSDDGSLPPEVEQLKQSLLSWLSTSAAAAFPSPSSSHPPAVGEKPVLRKLTAAATALSLKLEGQGEGTRWNDWLLEVVMRVAGGGAAREASLEVLSVAIEEVSRAELPGSKRCALLTCGSVGGKLTPNEKIAEWPTCLPFLQQLLTSLPPSPRPSPPLHPPKYPPPSPASPPTSPPRNSPTSSS